MILDVRELMNSRVPISGLDRPSRHLGYRGVTITDALEAGALTSFGSSGQRAVLAARAGMDLLLCSARDVTQGQEVTAALAGALEAGRLNPAAFNAAMQRITALRSAL